MFSTGSLAIAVARGALHDSGFEGLCCNQGSGVLVATVGGDPLKGSIYKGYY